MLFQDLSKSQSGYIDDRCIDQMIAECPEETRTMRIVDEFVSFFGALMVISKTV